VHSTALFIKSNKVLRPLILNSKTLDPRDENSPPVYQFETAMGAAISLFDNAAAVRVPRSRFFPVKTCNDLLAMRSDCFVFTEKKKLERWGRTAVNVCYLRISAKNNPDIWA
jgi:hypothetical protein